MEYDTDRTLTEHLTELDSQRPHSSAHPECSHPIAQMTSCRHGVDQFSLNSHSGTHGYVKLEGDDEIGHQYHESRATRTDEPIESLLDRASVEALIKN